MSDDTNRPIDAARTREPAPQAETDVSDDLLFDDITSVRTPDPVEQPVGDRIQADPIDAGVVRDQGDTALPERGVDTDDIIGTRGIRGPQIDDSYVSDGESTDGEPAETPDEDPPPDRDIDEPTTAPEPEPEPLTEAEQYELLNPYSSNWDFTREPLIDETKMGSAGTWGMQDEAPDEVMAQTDEDGIPVDQDGDFGFGGVH